MGQYRLPILALCVLCCITGTVSAKTISEAATESRLLAYQAVDLPVDGPSVHSGNEQAQQIQGRKSPWTAVGLSLLLPGTGHVYGGAKGRSRIFFGTEAVIWTLAIAFDRRAAWKNEDAVNYAVAHAGLNPDGKDDDFLEAVGFYQNRDEYNRAGRIIDPTRPFFAETADTYWQWDDPANRQSYRDIRNSAETAERNRTWTFYAAILNRVVSAVDAFRVVHKNNARQRDQEGLKVSVKPKISFNNPGIKLNARFTF